MRWPLGRAWAGGRPAEPTTARAGERGAKTSAAATRVRATSAGRATSFGSAPPHALSVTLWRDEMLKFVVVPAALALAASVIAPVRLTSPAFRGGGAIPKRFTCDGPCPPTGTTHRYVFVLFALARPLRLRNGATAGQFRRALGSAKIIRQTPL